MNPYNDRILNTETKIPTKEIGEITMGKERKPVKAGDITWGEFACPGCGKCIDRLREAPSGCCTVLPTAHIIRIDGICNSCTCVFTRIFRLEYLHTKVDLEPCPPEEIEEEVDITGKGDGAEATKGVEEKENVKSPPQSIDLTVE